MLLFQYSVVIKYPRNQNKTNFANKWNLFRNLFLNTKIQ